MLSKDLVFLDTETTGIDRASEIVEVALVDKAGNLLYESFVKPQNPIPADVTRIHNITNDMVLHAQAWPILWPTIRGFFVGKTIAAYNVEFDLRMMQQSMVRYRIPWKETLRSFCVMKLFAEFHGEWDPRRSTYRYISLDMAGKLSGIPLPNSHRAADDARLALAVLQHMAEYVPPSSTT